VTIFGSAGMVFRLDSTSDPTVSRLILAALNLLFFMIFKIFFNVTNFLGNHFYRYRDEGNATGGPLP
jgi:hypothetical protein